MAAFKQALAAALLVAAGTTPALAASSTSSAASDSIGTSVGSISGSIKNSSDSSSQATVAEGEYRIIEVASMPEQPTMARMKLQAVKTQQGADAEFYLVLPQVVVDQARLAQGGIVMARQKPYGLEFAQGPARQGFFQVLRDEWHRELHTRPVVL